MVVLFDIYQFKVCDVPGDWNKTKQNQKNKSKTKDKKKKKKKKRKRKKRKKPKTKARSPARSTDFLLTVLFFTPTTPSFKMVAVEMASCTVFPPGQ